MHPVTGRRQVDGFSPDPLLNFLISPSGQRWYWRAEQNLGAGCAGKHRNAKRQEIPLRPGGHLRVARNDACPIQRLAGARVQERGKVTRTLDPLLGDDRSRLRLRNLP